SLLCPWEDFLSSQRAHCDVIRKALSDIRLPPSLSQFEMMVKRTKVMSVRNKADLKRFDGYVVEELVQKIYEIFAARRQSHQMTQGLEDVEVVFLDQIDGLQVASNMRVWHRRARCTIERFHRDNGIRTIS
ncbi:hypothetical protein BHE90_017313, partial [Fusarium euwallaceae]